MGVRIELKYVVFNSDYEVIRWSDLDPEKAKEFIKENPMPPSRIYKNAEELLEDIKTAETPIFFSSEENDEFLDWFEELVEYAFW